MSACSSFHERKISLETDQRHNEVSEKTIIGTLSVVYQKKGRILVLKENTASFAYS
jgi:hypothetical protein